MSSTHIHVVAYVSIRLRLCAHATSDLRVDCACVCVRVNACVCVCACASVGVSRYKYNPYTHIRASLTSDCYTIVFHLTHSDVRRKVGVERCGQRYHLLVRRRRCKAFQQGSVEGNHLALGGHARIRSACCDKSGTLPEHRPQRRFQRF